jgi:hypothetical protein
MRWRGVGGELGQSFFSPGPRKRREAMILYYDTKEYMRRDMVCWQPLVFQAGGERRCRMKSFLFGGRSLFDIVSALTRPR